LLSHTIDIANLADQTRRIADLDGDGFADYLVIHEKSGAVVFWRNGGMQADGSWSWTEKSLRDDGEIQRYIEQAIYARLIPNAWSLSNEDYHPLILDSGEPCTDRNPLSKYLSDDTAETTSVCYEKHLYYFVSASGDFTRCEAGPGGITHCVDRLFTALPGMAALDEGKFGKVTKADLING
jgi:hypothetical protein